MKPVIGFNMCQQAEDNRITWNDDDPKYGVDIPVWTQTSYDVDCTDDTDCDNYCQSYNAEYVNGIKGKKCYSYEIVDYICLVIEWDNVLEDYKYVGGCLKDNAYYAMLPADRNAKYGFESIEIEIRSKKDPIIYAGEVSDYTFSFGTAFSYVSKLLDFLIIVALIAGVIVAFQVLQWRRRKGAGALLNQKQENSGQSNI
jgi:hypothetical protein